MMGYGDPRHPQPPRVPALLLSSLPESHRIPMLGDLSEEFSLQLSRGMAPQLATLWFWKELGSVIAASLITRLRYRLRGNERMPVTQNSPNPGRGHYAWSGFSYDLRFALRRLAKNRAFTIGAVVMLALGIGVNTAIFSMNAGMSRVVQRFHEPDELVFLWGVVGSWDRASVSAMDFREWRAQATAFEEMGIYREVVRYVTGRGEPERVNAVQLSANLLRMLGLDAELGRLHGTSDEGAAAPAVAVLTHRFWQERYGGEPDVLGRTIILNDVPVSVVGVLPAKVEFEMLWREAAVFTPLTLNLGVASWEDRGYRVIARLADGSSQEQAQAQMTTIAERLAEIHPESNAEVAARVEPFEDFFYSSDDKLAMGFMLLAVFAVLLIACVNLANLLLAKGTARQGEIAIRIAVGASRGRVVRQLFTESLLLSLLGGGLGILLGLWGMRLLLSSLPSTPFLPEEVSLDPVLLCYTLAIAVAAALAFGFTPALLASRVSLSESIKEGGAGKSASRSRKRFRSAILVAQLALTVPLVLACIMGFRQVQTLAKLDFGFSTERLLVAQVDPPAYRFAEQAQLTEFYNAAVEEVNSIPGVMSAAAGMTVPIGPGFSSLYGPLVVEGLEAEEGSARGPRGYQVVTPEFFQTLGVSLRHGRFITSADGPGDPTVAVVNEAMVRRYWPEQDPVGQRLVPDTAEGYWNLADFPIDIEVVGVVADFGATFHGDPPYPTVYLSHLQQPTHSMKLVARTAGDPLVLAPALRAAVKRVDAGVPLSDIRSGAGLVDGWLRESRTVAASLGILGLLALGMAVVGLYGMVAYSIAQRTFELGVRMVLGADRWAIRRTVMQSFLALSGTGLLIGLAISAIGGLVLRSQMAMLRVPIASTVVGLVLLLGGVVLLASYLPARRATSVEPIHALRCE